MKVANVIYEKELVNHTKVEYVNYFCEPIEYDKLDKTLPTLYVGWSFMKASNINNPIIQNADILKKKIITNELYWECSFEESKSSHVRGVDTFVGLAPQFYFTPKYTYTNLDPVFFQLKNIEDLMNILPNEIDSLYNYKNEMLYLLLDDIILGINLLLFTYFKFNVNDIYENITKRTKFAHVDLDGIDYLRYYKIFPNFDFLKRYLVTIL